jgi:isochorismate hydrolase
VGRWLDKCQGEAEDQHPRAQEIVAPIAPQANDILIEKTMPSAFFTTNLVPYLVSLKADCVIVWRGDEWVCAGIGRGRLLA